MFRVAASTLAKRGLSRSAPGARSWAAAAPSSSFHFSAPRNKEEEKTDGTAELVEEAPKSSNMAYFAIPLGVAAAVPILEFQYFIPNEETLLASTFLGFCVVAYTQGGEMMANMFKEEANSMLKAQNNAEEEVISKLEETVEYMELTENIVDDYQGVMDLTEVSYAKLNASGKIRPQYLLKAQMEKMLTMVAAEEHNLYDKAKIAMMEEATAAVNAKFASSKQLKKDALTSAIAKLTGAKSSSKGGDPVQAQFVQFFADKKKAAKASDDGSEEKEARRGVLSKMNAVAENEEMYFRFDLETGQPKKMLA